MIYTSYFAKKMPEGMCPIAICAKTPDFYKGLTYKKLAPKWSFFKVWKETHDNDYYISHFKTEVLNSLNPQDIYKELCSLSNGKDIVLLCYEKSGSFCHRHLVAKWFRDNGISCEELV